MPLLTFLTNVELVSRCCKIEGDGTFYWSTLKEPYMHAIFVPSSITVRHPDCSINIVVKYASSSTLSLIYFWNKICWHPFPAAHVFKTSAQTSMTPMYTTIMITKCHSLMVICTLDPSWRSWVSKNRVIREIGLANLYCFIQWKVYTMLCWLGIFSYVRIGFPRPL